MKITYLDRPSYLPEPAVKELREMGEFVLYEDVPAQAEALRRLNDTDIAILEWTAIDRKMFEQLARVRYIVVGLTGYSFIDVTAAKDCGILVSNIPNYSRQSVAEHAFALLLAVNRKVISSDQAVRRGEHDAFAPFLGQELYGKTLGILGLGDIGSWVAKIGRGFGMDVIGASRKPKQLPGVIQVDLDELLKRSDALIVCADRNRATERLLSAEKLKRMKTSAFLVSIVGGIIDEEALARMLQNGELAGAGLDVPQKDSPLIQSEKAVITSHIGWYTQNARARLVSTVLDNVRKFIDGCPQNIVNP